MCGIAGILGAHDSAAERAVDRMLDALPHRGPNDRGLQRTPAGVLGHTRLSIVGVETGHQPILADDGRRVLVANGEIYNFERLRAELSGEYEFITESDSEVIIHLFHRDGPGFLEHLDGMFAFCVTDGDDYLLARDPIGIKPLYYGRPHGAAKHVMAFASELGAMTLADVDEVREFPPGHYFTPAAGFVQYYDVAAYPDNELITDPAEAIPLVRRAVTDAAEKRLLADPTIVVSSFLSGGLDSSIVAAIAAQRIARINTFAVGMADEQGRPSGDIEAARIVADHIGSDHHELIFTADEYYDVLDMVIGRLETYDPALVRSAVPCYFTCQLAAQHATVVLTGEGADEVFAGYQFMKRLPFDELNQSCREQTLAVHNINLQRADRMGMAFSLELRVPFFDTEVIDLGMRLHPSLKIAEHDGQLVEKWVLRKAFEDLLPREITWRFKVQYAQGAGCEDLGERLAERTVTDAQVAALAAEFPDAGITSRETALYFSIFRRHHPQDSVLESIDLWPGFDFAEERAKVRGAV